MEKTFIEILIFLEKEQVSKTFKKIVISNYQKKIFQT